MYKHRIFLQLLLFLAGYAYSNDSKIVFKEIKKEVEFNLDENTLHELNKFSNKNLTPIQQISFLDGVIKRCIKQGLPNSLKTAYFLMGKAYKTDNQPKIALQFIQLGIQTKAPNPAPYNVNIELGEVYSLLGDYKQSNLYFNKIVKEKESNEYRLKAKYGIATNYYLIENYNAAIQLFEEVLKIEQNQNNLLGIIKCYEKLAICYINVEDVEKGIEYYKLSLKLINSKNQDANLQLSKTKESVSKALSKSENFEAQLEVLTAGDITSDNSAAKYLNLGLAYFNNNKQNDAIENVERAMTFNEYQLIDKSEINYIKTLANELENKQQLQKAIQFYKFYQTLSDSIDLNIQKLGFNNKELIGYKNLLEIEVYKKNKEINSNAIQNLVLNQELKNSSLQFQKSVIILLVILFIIALVAIFLILKISKKQKIANQKLALRSLRSQMNPHFIFNALNSVNSFISMNDEKSANLFLSNFSKLMRLVMEHSEYEFIPLSKEFEILKLYLELENFRFKDKFDYQLIISPDIDEDYYSIPPMIIQPFIENAIWHGLRYKDDMGLLVVSISKVKNNLIITITDDGIGRKRSSELKTENQKQNKSVALKNIDERIKIISALHKIKIEVKTSDLNKDDNTGTIITITIQIA